LLGNGSDEVLDLIYRAFCEPKTDSVILMPPTYGMYKVLANLNGISCKEVLLTRDFQLNVPEIIRAVDESTKLIFICSPNNPTGNKFLKSDIETILNNFSGIVVIDEAYIDFSDEKSWLTRLQEYPNLIVSQTFSKAYGLASIRLGICYASPEIISILNKIKPPYNINILTQNAALQKLNEIEKIDQQIVEINKNKLLLIKELSEINFIKKSFPSQANFILVRVDDANRRYEELLQHGFVVRNRTKEPLCENCLRFTIGTEQEVLSLINTLKKLA
jgi:histidinol-phosphate aminotransferase